MSYNFPTSYHATRKTQTPSPTASNTESTAPPTTSRHPPSIVTTLAISAAMNGFAFAAYANGLLIYPAIGLGLAIPAMVKRLSIHCTKVSVISAFSSPARSRKKEHEEFALNMNLVDVLPPGLFEMVFGRNSPMLHHERLQPPSHDYPADEWNVVEKSKAPYLLSAGGISSGLLTIT